MAPEVTAYQARPEWMWTAQFVEAVKTTAELYEKFGRPSEGAAFTGAHLDVMRQIESEATLQTLSFTEMIKPWEASTSPLPLQASEGAGPPTAVAVAETSIAEAALAPVEPSAEAALALVKPQEEELSPKANVTAAPAEAFVGTWLYKGKYMYCIEAVETGLLRFVERLSNGRQTSGILVQHGRWRIADLKYEDEECERLGSMRFRFLQDQQALQTNFKNAHKEDWGPCLIAYRAKSDAATPKGPPRKPECFDVLLTKILIKRSPLEADLSWGFVPKGRRLHVAPVRAMDNEGREWVELLPWELRRSCEEACKDPAARGFA
eukprot:CAMPEP_0180506088 /NCGR_PEP_ID=MMETSP1036_2-20121128/47758_1 /TAXON_ID=632150 /ORGANISM="Azadinium spinosum, Strain 3D9" /LENGTH=320 /DNA_ID=CAMNT_0022515917 /DNA_START=40 /DNA_END=998 /DNA_ORIENTATION=-